MDQHTEEPTPAAGPNDSATAEARAAVREHSTVSVPESTEPRRDSPSAGSHAPDVAPDGPMLVHPTLPGRLRDRLTEGDTARFARVAEAAGMPTDTAQKGLDFFAQRIEANATNPATYEDSARQLREAWGAHFDQNLRFAHHAMDALGLRDAIKRAGLVDDAPLVNYLAQLGAYFARRPQQAQAAQQARADLRGDVQRQYDAIMQNPQHAYWSKRNPVAHKQAVAEVERLAGILYGTAPLDDPGQDVRPIAPQPSTDRAVAAAAQALKAQAVITEWLTAGPKHPINDRAHPQHAEAVVQFNRLNAIVATAKSDPRSKFRVENETKRANAARYGSGHAPRRTRG